MCTIHVGRLGGGTVGVVATWSDPPIEGDPRTTIIMTSAGGPGESVGPQALQQLVDMPSCNS